MGCGLGLWAEHLSLASDSWDVHAMDLDETVIERNRSVIPTVTFHQGGVGDASSLQPFDVVTVMDVLEHVPGIQDKMARLCQMVRPGGYLIAVMPVYDGPLGPIVRLLDKDPTHIHKWSRSEWLGLLKNHLTDPEWHGLFRILLPGSIYVHLSSSRLRSVSPAILIAGRVA